MINHEIPLLKRKLLSERILLAVDEDTKKVLDDLKLNYSVDVSEWMRRLINKELPELKKKVSAA